MSENNGLSLSGKTILMSGGSRGIGLAIAVAAAKQGANVAILAKTDQPHPKLKGTIHTAVDEIREAGGQAIGIVGDVRQEESVQQAVEKTVAEFGGIDVVVNNASAISLTGTEATSPKMFDLMQAIEQRGTWLLTRASIPHLRKSANPHILSLSPPMNMDPRWLAPFPAYTLAKYGMTLITLSIGAELADDGVAANCLWPETAIATAATDMLLGGEENATMRGPEIMADAAVAILTSDARTTTGNTYIDVDVLAANGVTDLSKYGPTSGLAYDIYIDPPAGETTGGPAAWA